MISLSNILLHIHSLTFSALIFRASSRLAALAIFSFCFFAIFSSAVGGGGGSTVSPYAQGVYSMNEKERIK
jgi:hypothetical protein